MTRAFHIGLCLNGEAVHTNPTKSLDEQKREVLTWIGTTNEPLTDIIFVMGEKADDLSAAYARTWVKQADDIFDYNSVDDMPLIIQTHAYREAEVALEWGKINARDDAEAARELASDYRADAL